MLFRSHSIVLTMPEDILTLIAPSAEAKSDWIWALNNAIDKALRSQRQHNTPKISQVCMVLFMYLLIHYYMFFFVFIL